MRTRDAVKEKAIRQKALKMIVKEGFDGFSMQKLARQAEVSPATLYIYFKDRDDLILQLAVEHSRKMFEVSLQGFDPGMSFAEGLKVQWLNRAQYCLKNPDEKEFLEQIRHSPFHERSASLLGGEFKEAMRTFVQRAIANGELIKLPLEVFWSIAYAPLYNLINFHNHGKSIGGRDFIMTKKHMLQTLDLVTKALKP